MDQTILISEGIRMAKKYGSIEGYKFVNAVLDKYLKLKAPVGLKKIGDDHALSSVSDKQSTPKLESPHISILRQLPSLSLSEQILALPFIAIDGSCMALT